MTTHSADACCALCVFFRPYIDAGRCHRHAPLVIITQPPREQREYTVWPRVEKDEWCGDYERKQRPIPVPPPFAG